MPGILIIQTAFIGDVILATPVVEALHAEYPGTSIDFLLRKGNEGLLEGHPYISHVHIWDKKSGKYGNLAKMIGTIRKVKYDVVINLHRFLNTGLVTVLSGAGETIGFTKNPLSLFFSKRIPHVIDISQGKVHEIDRNLMLIRHLVKDNMRMKPRLYPSPADYAKISPDKPYITISPTSVWYTKQYPPDRWVNFINLIDSSVIVYLLGAPSDITSCEYIRSQTNHGNVNVLAGKLSFLESAALMKHAVMNYANDSAPMHLASAMNAPVTAVFCSTVPAFGFGPLSSCSYVIETPEKLTCRPCGLHGYRQCPEGHFNCAKIDPDHLLHAMPQQIKA